MAVRCPCGDQCRGYYPSRPSDCELIEESEQMPQRFVHALGGSISNTVDINEGFFGKLLGGMVAAGAAAFAMGKADSYEVFECPDCRCEVCFGYFSGEGSRRKIQVGELASCKD